MEYRDPIPINYHHPPPHQTYQPPPPHQTYQPPPPHQTYQQPPPHQTYQPLPPHQTYEPPPLLHHPSSSSSSVSLLPNPNPNSIHSFENPFPYPAAAAATATDGTRPPAVEPYPNSNPYAPHPPFGGPHSIAAQSYQQEVSDYYYQLHQLQQYALSSSSTAKVGSGNTIADLAIKKLRVLQCGAPADSVRICSVCNVVCNSDKVFASHLAGEKHKLKALGLPFKGLKLKVPSHTKALHFTKTAKQLHFTRKAKQAGPKTPASKALIAFVGSSVCNVCKIDCQTQEVLNNHKLGKKHIRNLQMLQESITPKPKPANANPGTSGSKADNKQAKQNAAPATEEDLETKKQKVLNGGAAADAVRVCTRCNVVCNSQEVYNSHVVGKKHLAMVNKQRETAPVH